MGCLCTLVGGGAISRAGSVVGGAEKIKLKEKKRPCRGNDNRQIAKIYTYIPIHERVQAAAGTCRQSLHKVRMCDREDGGSTIRAKASVVGQAAGTRRYLSLSE